MPAVLPIARAVATRQKARPSAALGQHVRTLRLVAGLTHAQVSQRTKIRPAQWSRLESGYNVESKQYALVARVLGFRTPLEMFRADAHDPHKTHLDRAWSLLSPDQQARLLRFANRLVLGDD